MQSTPRAADSCLRGHSTLCRALFVGVRARARSTRALDKLKHRVFAKYPSRVEICRFAYGKCGLAACKLQDKFNALACVTHCERKVQIPVIHTTHTASGGILRRTEQYANPRYTGNVLCKLHPVQQIPVSAVLFLMKSSVVGLNPLSRMKSLMR